MIAVTKRDNEQFPIGCSFNEKPMQKFTPARGQAPSPAP